MIKYSDLIKKTMPPEKLITAKRCIVGHYLVRPICNIVSIPFIERKIDPTKITIFSGLFPIIAFIAFSNSSGFLIGWISIFIWNVLDGVDGNVARYNNQCTNKGEIWDAAVGWLAIIVFYYGMGFTAYYHPGIWLLNYEHEPLFLLMGSISAMCWIFPRLVMHKKMSINTSRELPNSLDRGRYGLIKSIVFNITSINGLGAVIFIITYYAKLCGICMVFYFLISIVSCVSSLYLLLFKE